MKNIWIFCPKIFNFSVINFSVYLNRRVFVMKNLCIFGYPNCASEDSDQTALMRRLIWIFTGRKLSKVRFPTLWFKRLEIVEITELVDIFLQALLAWKKKKKKKILFAKQQQCHWIFKNILLTETFCRLEIIHLHKWFVFGFKGLLTLKLVGERMNGSVWVSK